jgi:hypothetical protein
MQELCGRKHASSRIMKKIILLSFLLFIKYLAFTQNLTHTMQRVILLSTTDSTLFIYNYPVFSGTGETGYASRLNKQVTESLLPDSSVLKMLKKLDNIPENHRHEVQEITVSVTYQNDQILCLQTAIKTHASVTANITGDMYYNTYSIASGNIYNLNNLFTTDLFEVVYHKYENALSGKGVDLEDFKRHLVNFGLLSGERCSGCFTLQIILNTFYDDAGPLPFEITSNEIAHLIKPHSPIGMLYKTSSAGSEHHEHEHK